MLSGDSDGATVGVGGMCVGVGGMGVVVGKGVGIAVAVAAVGAVGVGGMLSAGVLCDCVGDAAGLTAHPNQSGISVMMVTVAAILSRIIVLLCKMH